MSSKRSRAAFESDRHHGPPPHAPFARYGTPLPPFEANARDDGTYLPLWKQEVTDERGRKRLHGAFTGGFSAGYFNTVGSKEGWTPGTFVSSRSNRAKPQHDGAQQRPEHFMDEEDLAEQAESQKLETRGAFAGLGSTAGHGAGKAIFSDLFRSTGETHGVKLLQRMGWRPGQGIGPKVRRRAAGDTSGETHLFAPKSSRMIRFVRKADRKGLGFAGETPLHDTTRDPDHSDGDSDVDSRILSRKTKVATRPQPPKKSGFGVGVLNDHGSDDDDPYSVGPKISYSRTIGGDKKKKKRGIVASNANPNVVRPNTQPSKKLLHRTANVANVRKCHDGRLPLHGFVLATSLLAISENKYPLPEVPPGWKPARQNNANTATLRSAADAAKASTLDPRARGELLGEQQLPGKSIFDFLTPAQRDKLAAASGKTDLPAALGEKAPEGYERSEAEKRRTLWDLVPALSKETAAAALARGRAGWMPYAEDVEKRDRYQSYLELRAGLHANLPRRPHTSSLDEWATEMREFAQAAEIFQPVSGLMASRFTSASSSSNTPPPAGGTPGPAPPEKEEAPAAKAARMNMYGPLTRTRRPFYPTRLLCKRFNVAPPSHVAAGRAGDDLAAGAPRLDILSQASIDRMMMEANFPAARTARGDAAAGGGMGAASVPPHPARAAVDVETNAALEGPKAGEEVFRAIFGDDDAHDDERVGVVG